MLLPTWLNSYVATQLLPIEGTRKPRLHEIGRRKISSIVGTRNRALLQLNLPASVDIEESQTRCYLSFFRLSFAGDVAGMSVRASDGGRLKTDSTRVELIP